MILCPLQLTPWLTAIGYSLCYGTIIVKMFRIFYIIHNLFSKKRVSYYASILILTKYALA